LLNSSKQLCQLTGFSSKYCEGEKITKCFLIIYKTKIPKGNFVKHENTSLTWHIRHPPTLRKEINK
jgi:hypothetical protein